MSYGFSSVDVRFGSRPALESVDLEAVPGRITVLVGGDGAGKTTSARALVGLIDPSGGDVRRPAADQIGYQPEAAGTWHDLTVSENLQFVATAYRIRDRAERIRWLLDVTNLSAAADRLAGRLSGGMRQKLAVAMAILARPKLAVLDEPTTGLDPLSRAELWRTLAQAAGEGAAVVVTTTYLDEAERAASVVVLDAGRVLATGTADSIRAGFVGRLATSSERPVTELAWRRGDRWRLWAPEGDLPAGSQGVPPDLEDVVTAAALQRRLAVGS